MSEEPRVVNRRRKPWYRLRNIVLAIVAGLALAIGYVVYETVALMSAEPNPMHDYRAEFVTSVVQEIDADPARAQEAWDLFVEVAEDVQAMEEEAVELLQNAHSAANAYEERFPGDGWHFSFDLGRTGPSVHPRFDRERELLQEMRKAGIFDRVDQFVELSPAINQQASDEASFDLLMSNNSSYRSLAVLLMFRGRVALEMGDQLEFVRSMAGALAIAQACGNEGSILSQLIGLAINWMTLRELVCSIDEHELSEETSRALLEVMDRFELLSPIHAVRGERMMFLDLVQHSFTDDGDGSGYVCGDLTGGLAGFDREANLTFVEAFMWRFFGPTRRQMVNAIEDRFDRFERELAKPPVDRWMTFDATAGLDDGNRAEQLMSIMAPSIRVAMESDLIGRLQWAGTKVILQLERFRARTGREPESLAEVESTLEVTLPSDPLHGDSFVYHRLEEPDEFGRMYLVYSTGYDQTDDGGSEATSDDHDEGRHAPLKDRSSTGFDFVINQPREPWPEGLDEGEE